MIGTGAIKHQKGIIDSQIDGSGIFTYRTFRGLMIKHQRVQMRPVQVRAKFWVKESFSAGRAKSAIPAMTIAHCNAVPKSATLRLNS